MSRLESGAYPDGAEFDPRAPWNQDNDNLSPEWFELDGAEVIITVKADNPDDAHYQLLDALKDLEKRYPDIEIVVQKGEWRL